MMALTLPKILAYIRAVHRAVHRADMKDSRADIGKGGRIWGQSNVDRRERKADMMKGRVDIKMQCRYKGKAWQIK